MLVAAGELLVDELAHRIRNILAVVLSIASSTIRPKSDPASFKAFEDRLIALSTAQRLITDVNWSSVSLSELVMQVAERRLLRLPALLLAAAAG